MFAEYVFRQSEAEYYNKLLLIDADRLDDTIHYSTYFEKHGFRMIEYTDDLRFRAEHEDIIRDPDHKYLLISKTNAPNCRAPS